MECRYRAEDLLAYVDNELSPKETQNMDNHLCSCNHCKQEVRELSDVTSLLGMLPDIEFSEDIRVRLSSKLKETIEAEETAPAASLWKIWKIFVPAFASMVCLLLIYTAVGPQKSIQQGNSQGEVIEMASLATLNVSNNLNISLNGKKLAYNKGQSLMTLKEEDTLLVGQGCNALVSYPGDINVQLTPGSRFTIYDRWIKLTQGKGYFKLAKQHDGFQVTTPDVTVTVVGTTFTVGTQGKGSTVSLIEGSVRFETRKGSEFMTPGQTLQTTHDGSFTLRKINANVRKEILFNMGQRATGN